jgi:SAM-dependent MidA family methyltransferase
MQRALYDPSVGYYARRREIGRAGDFYTSVSVGSCFGGLLAEYVAQQWLAAGSPSRYAIVEMGGNDGSLAHDVLGALQERHPSCFAVSHYTLGEPLESLRAWQAAKLAGFANKVSWAPGFPAAEECGVFLANELMDAFPVELVRYTGGTWHRLGLDDDDEAAAWQDLPLTPELALAIAQFPEDSYPEGYQTEVMLGLADWWKEAATLFSRHGRWLLLDYGLSHLDYYASYRTTGTLRGYRQHQMLPDFPRGMVFGETDLTTHVNWTVLADAAGQAGLQAEKIRTQSQFLTPLAAPVLLSLERDPARLVHARQWLRQFQTLTHPEQMGSKFQVFEVKR